MSTFQRLTLGVVSIAVATTALGQNVPVRTLSRPDAEFSEPFTYLSMIRELKDGRLLLIDPAEKTLQLVDLARGTSTRLGREGSGPGEYAIPFRLLALPGDTTAMSDMVNSRLLLINPDATVGGFIDPTVPPPAGVIRYGSGGTMPTEADTRPESRAAETLTSRGIRQRRDLYRATRSGRPAILAEVQAHAVTAGQRPEATGQRPQARGHRPEATGQRVHSSLAFFFR